MDKIRDANGSVRRLSAVTTIIIYAAVIGIPYVGDRAYRRWSNKNRLFVGPRARVERLRTGYQQKRANVSDVAQVIGGVIAEVARATSTGSGT